MPLHPRFVVRFDRILESSADYRPNFAIRSGVFTNVTFREIRVDPVARQVIFVIADDLLPQTRYVLHVESGPDASSRIAAIDGAPFDGPFDQPFTTESARAPGEVDETTFDPDASPDDPCVAAAIFAQSCAGANCHGSGTEAPAMGLNLANSAGVQATAVDRAAASVAYEATPSAGQPAAGVFPYGLPIIRTGQSAASYLIYKVLRRGPAGDPAGAAAADPSFVMGDVPDPTARAVADLQAVRGSGMPHDSLPSDPTQAAPLPPLQWSEVHLLRRWIDAGARPCTR